MATTTENRTQTAVPMQTRAHATLNAIDWVALVLMIIGAVNWGLVGAMGLDLVAAVFGAMTPVTRGIYVLVGLAGLYGIFMSMKLGRKP